MVFGYQIKGKEDIQITLQSQIDEGCRRGNEKRYSEVLMEVVKYDLTYDGSINLMDSEGRHIVALNRS